VAHDSLFDAFRRGAASGALSPTISALVKLGTASPMPPRGGTEQCFHQWWPTVARHRCSQSRPSGRSGNLIGLTLPARHRESVIDGLVYGRQIRTAPSSSPKCNMWLWPLGSIVPGRSRPGVPRSCGRSARWSCPARKVFESRSGHE
jgi:hypothetical protein